MRDLTSRLREIVRRENDAGRHFPEMTPGVIFDSAADVGSAASQLGGTVHRVDGAACVVVERTWESFDWHGRRRVESYEPEAARPIGLFDRRLASDPDWFKRVVFFDLETTGLSGGAGTLPFVTGCGWFKDGGFVARQFVLAGPAGEPAMLDALQGVLADATLLVTFNGSSFDLPVMDMRWAFHRRPNPAEGLPHWDVLAPARRFWRRRDESGAACTLTALERSILGVMRTDDVPGFEIPARYFHFLRTGDAATLGPVLDHNRLDLLSLAAVMSRLLGLAEDGPDACQEAGERLALGRLYERAGDLDRAVRSYELATADGPRDVRQEAFVGLAVLLRRERRHADAAAAWQQVLDLASSAAPGPSSAERRAAEALAVHHEHRDRNLETARRYAVRLGREASGRLAEETTHRLARIDRKLGAAENAKGGPSAAPLLMQVD